MRRKFPQKIKKVVVKVGSSLIATYKMKPKITQLNSLVEQICDLKKQGIEVILGWSLGGVNKQQPSVTYPHYVTEGLESHRTYRVDFAERGEDTR